METGSQNRIFRKGRFYTFESCLNGTGNKSGFFRGFYGFTDFLGRMGLGRRQH